MHQTRLVNLAGELPASQMPKHLVRKLGFVLPPINSGERPVARAAMHAKMILWVRMVKTAACRVRESVASSLSTRRPHSEWSCAGSRVEYLYASS